MMWSWLLIFKMLICGYSWSIYSISGGKTAVLTIVQRNELLLKYPFDWWPSLSFHIKCGENIIQSWLTVLFNMLIWTSLIGFSGAKITFFTLNPNNHAIFDISYPSDKWESDFTLNIPEFGHLQYRDGSFSRLSDQDLRII